MSVLTYRTQRTILRHIKGGFVKKRLGRVVRHKVDMGNFKVYYEEVAFRGKTS